MAGISVWIGPLSALAGVGLGALLNPWGARRQSWLTTRREAFDRAIASVKATDLARNYPRHVAPAELGPDAQRAADFNAELAIRGFERFTEATHEMRAALAALEPYFVPVWNSDQWLITDETAASLLAQLKLERHRAPIWRRT